MRGILSGRVAVITGAGRGIGREHARLFARLGARVLVNDLDADEAEAVAWELRSTPAVRSAGGDARSWAGDVADWAGARQMIEAAVDEFGGLSVLINNAGMVADRFLVNMSEAEWDDTIRVHLKGHFAPLRWAADYWRDQAKGASGSDAAATGEPTLVDRAVVNTSSISGLGVNPGQANYGAAKAAIAALTQSAAAELGRYGVRVNAVAPLARTRLTESVPTLGTIMAPPADPDTFDAWHPANVSPLVAYLASAECRLTGQVFAISGGRVQRYEPWRPADTIETDRRWSVEALAEAISLFDNPPA